MRCEIIAVGSELLLGQTIDTNSSWMGGQLALAGINSHFQTKVGDNLERMVSCLRLALERSDAVILCGGLGPTQDDITREAIAGVMGVAMVRDENIVQRIRRRFEARGIDMPDSNLQQADVPIGASPLKEMPGTAPGLMCPLGDKVIYAVPGIPSEMREMVRGSIIPDLQQRAGVSAVIRSRVLRTWGQAESALAETLAERIEQLDKAGNPTLAFLASGIEGLKVRITAKAANETAVNAILDAEEKVLRGLLGDLVFGVDDENMEAAIIRDLRRRGLTLAVAESLTGGLMGSRLTTVPGASDVFRGGLIAYASDIKFAQLGVPEGPVISEAAAGAMALGVCKHLNADVGLATTGVAGPAEQEGFEPGTVFVAAAIKGHVTARRLKLPGDREKVRQFAVINLLNLLRLKLLGDR